MAQLTLIKTPARNTSASNISVWGAAANPQVFNYQRADYDITNVVSLGVNEIQVNISTVLTSDEAGALIDSFVKIKTPLYDDTLQVENVNVTGSNTQIILYSPGLSVNDGPGFLNSDILKTQFKAKTTIVINNVVYVQRHSADKNGLVRADVAGVLKQFVVSADNFKYDTQDYFDNNLFIKYSIQYTYEYYDINNNLKSTFNSLAGTFFVIHSALQMGNSMGSNMGAYVPFLSEPNPDKLAKFLTVFNEPTFNVGYPFDLAFVYSEQLAGKTCFIKYIPLDLNRQPLGSGGFEDVVLAINVTDNLLINDTDKVIISNNIDESGFRQLPAGLGVCRVNFTDLFNEYTKFVQVFIYYVSVPNPATFNWTDTQNVLPYIDSNLQIKKGTDPVVDSFFTESGSVQMDAGSPFSVLQHAIDPLPVNAIGWSNIQSASPNHYIDCNCNININGVNVVSAVVNQYGSLSGAAGLSYSVLSFGNDAPAAGAVNPRINLRVTKNGTVIFQKTVDYVPNNIDLIYSGTLGVGANYIFEAFTVENGVFMPYINIPDNGDAAKQNLVIKKNGTTIFSKTIPYQVGNIADLYYTGTCDNSAVYTVDGYTSLNTADLANVNIAENPVIDHDPTQVTVTETKTIKIERPAICKDKNLYVKWLNIVGGWDYMLFNYDIDNNLEIADRSYYDVPLLDYDTQRETENVLFTSARDTFGMSKDGLTPDDMRALASIGYSPKTYLLEGLNPYIWLTGSVDAKTQTLFNSNDGLGSYSSNIKLPNKTLQF